MKIKNLALALIALCGVLSGASTSWAQSKGNGLTGQYFSDANLSVLKTTRVDKSINFDWGGGAPSGTAVTNVDNFSVRWTGWIEARYSETYTFFLSRDNGARLRIGGQLLVDKWDANSWTGQNGLAPETFKLVMTAGKKVPITLEYFESAGGANIKLEWQSTGAGCKRQPREVVAASQLYPAPVDGALYGLEPQNALGKRLDVSSNGAANGTNAQIWESNSNPNQSWKLLRVGEGIYELEPGNAPGQRLDVSANGSANGTNVQIWQTYHNGAQRWNFTPQGNDVYSLEPGCAPGKVLDVNGRSSANGANVQIWDDFGQSNQRWRLVPGTPQNAPQNATTAPATAAPTSPSGGAA